MISQKNISTNTPMGGNLVSRGGATFRAWAPLPAAVYHPRTGQTDDLLLAKDANGYWTGFVDTASEGDLYRFWVVGATTGPGFPGSDGN